MRTAHRGQEGLARQTTQGVVWSGLAQRTKEVRARRLARATGESARNVADSLSVTRRTPPRHLLVYLGGARGAVAASSLTAVSASLGR